MKSVFFKGMAAAALTFGLVFAGCSEDSGSSGDSFDVGAIGGLPGASGVADFDSTATAYDDTEITAALTTLNAVLGDSGFKTALSNAYNAAVTAKYPNLLTDQAANLLKTSYTLSININDNHELADVFGLNDGEAVVKGSSTSSYNGSVASGLTSTAATGSTWTERDNGSKTFEIKELVNVAGGTYKVAGTIITSADQSETVTVTDRSESHRASREEVTEKIGVFLSITNVSTGKAGKFKVTASQRTSDNGRSVVDKTVKNASDIEVWNNTAKVFSVSSENGTYASSVNNVYSALQNFGL